MAHEVIFLSEAIDDMRRLDKGGAQRILLNNPENRRAQSG